MLELLLIIFIGLLGGVAVGLQAPMGGIMGQRLGGAAASVIIHAGGFIASLALLIMRGGEQINQWRSIPWYMLASGVFGLILYLTITQTLPKLGATSAVLLIIVGQLMAGMVIDHFGLFELPVRSIDLSRAMAALLLISGAYLMVR
ncbi:DMT family transporter [Pseudovibrio sp. Tun.PSC04-5.I4]|uniref:DMT family transporter n=1 Tax=Pseudovibrio sp. Tun.PSC04-5.I4 TaxID=1798213 RepID=UPI00088DC744|nr:DMT family transporter [Pseudovibrio sp. Tun.PSC04-5.I4]SDR47474.1 transporter family-2 protein [Pseudovibrio sp. Tun.PSC04-5.I4]